MYNMFYDFFYYNSIGLTLSLCCFYTLEYISHPSNFRERLRYHKDTVIYWSLDKIVSIKMLYDDHVMAPIENMYRKIQTPRNREKEDFRYTVDGKEIVFKRFERGEEYYYSLKDKENTVVEPFMSMELYYRDRVYEIGNQIRHFCVIGNVFDEMFFMKLIEKYCGEKITSSSPLLNHITVHIVDTNCDVAEVSMNKHTIVITKEGYNIK